MDKATMVICLFIGIIQIVLIFSVIRTAENTQRMKNILEKISNDLSSITIHKPENATICPKCKQSNISFASDFSFTTCPCGQSIMIRIRRDA